MLERLWAVSALLDDSLWGGGDDVSCCERAHAVSASDGGQVEVPCPCAQHVMQLERGDAASLQTSGMACELVAMSASCQ